MTNESNSFDHCVSQTITTFSTASNGFCGIRLCVQNKPDADLVRGIRRWDLVAIGINGIIGAGIFGLPSKVYSLNRNLQLIAFVVCALVVALIILCFAEVSSRFDETGGPYLYAREAFQPAVAFEVGWLIWLARVTAFAANCNLMINYLSYFWLPATTPFWRASIIVLVVAVLAVINLLGHQASSDRQQRIHDRQARADHTLHRRRAVFPQSAGVTSLVQVRQPARSHNQCCCWFMRLPDSRWRRFPPAK